MKIHFDNDTEYDEDTIIPAGDYEVIEDGINGWPMICVNGEYIDICDEV